MRGNVGGRYSTREREEMERKRRHGQLAPLEAEEEMQEVESVGEFIVLQLYRNSVFLCLTAPKKQPSINTIYFLKNPIVTLRHVILLPRAWLMAGRAVVSCLPFASLPP